MQAASVAVLRASHRLSMSFEFRLEIRLLIELSTSDMLADYISCLRFSALEAEGLSQPA